MKSQAALAGLAFALLTGNAQAADLPAPAAVVGTPVATTTYDWNGIYAGGQLGYGWFTGEDNLNNPSTDLDSVIGGAHVGYNHMLGQFVLGVEGEANLADFNATTPLGLKADINWMFAGRVRAGYAFDRFLAYATTGVSFAELTLKSSFNNASDSNTHTGVVLGGGVEAFVTDRISVGLEYQHHWFGDQTYNLGGRDFEVDGNLDIVGARASFHF
ncbi:porin family protein [Rhodobacterales bacterium]|nr:porin family protein [Rhodobacterales bacterium]